MDIRGYKDPEPRASAGQARLVADQLRQQPMKWAIIEEYDVPVEPTDASPEQLTEFADKQKKVRAKASSRASLIKQGRVSAFKSVDKKWPGTFAAVSRTEDVLDENDQPTGKKVIRVYARYLGEEHAYEPSAKKPAQPTGDGSGPSPAEASEAIPVDEVVSV